MEKPPKHSDDPVELSGVLQRQIDHLGVGDFGLGAAALREVQSVASDLPLDAASLLLLILSDEGRQLFLVGNHEHGEHVLQRETVVRALGTARNLVPNRVHKLINEEVVLDLGHVLLLS